MPSPAMIEPLYVADTHALLWYLVKDRRLSARAEEIFRAAERGETRIVVSAIVLAELYHLNQKKQTPVDFEAIYVRLESSPAYRLVSFDPVDVLDFSVDAAVTELHDRIIAGLARRLSAPLLTLDPVITESGITQVEW